MLTGTRLSMMPVATGIIKPPPNNWSVINAATAYGELNRTDMKAAKLEIPPTTTIIGIAFGPLYPPTLSKTNPPVITPATGPNPPIIP